ncbi:hypothetical protein [Serratia liquefaciens]|uniref:hypothetical protein n=1 Tax=Serratia liquefaciens TaxID=614 RepID=UPI0021CAB36E|nr:hypothetical protein [Serratia liquefaciens]
MVTIAGMTSVTFSQLSHRRELACQQNAEQENMLVQQSGSITILHTEDTRTCAIMAKHQQSEIYQRKYQDAIKNNKCAAERIPDD